MRDYLQPTLNIVELSLDDAVTTSPTLLGFGNQDDFFGNVWEENQ